MDWSAVIERLRWFGNNSTEQANALVLECGKREDVIRHRERADIYLTLASALDAGLPVYGLDKLVEGITPENRHPPVDG